MEIACCSPVGLHAMQNKVACALREARQRRPSGPQRASAARRAGKLHVITLRHVQVLQEVAPEPKSPGSREPERRSHMRSLFQEPGEAQEERRRHPLRLDTPERCR